MSHDRSTTRNGRVFWSAAVVVVVLDVITKWLAEQYLEPFRPTPVIGNVARLTLVYNRGAAFSMSLGNYSRLIFGAFAVIAIVILWRLSRQTAAAEPPPGSPPARAWGGPGGTLLH